MMTVVFCKHQLSDRHKEPWRLIYEGVDCWYPVNDRQELILKGDVHRCDICRTHFFYPTQDNLMPVEIDVQDVKHNESTRRKNKDPRL